MNEGHVDIHRCICCNWLLFKYQLIVYFWMSIWRFESGVGMTCVLECGKDACLTIQFLSVGNESSVYVRLKAFVVDCCCFFVVEYFFSTY